MCARTVCIYVTGRRQNKKSLSLSVNSVQIQGRRASSFPLSRAVLPNGPDGGRQKRKKKVCVDPANFIYIFIYIIYIQCVSLTHTQTAPRFKNNKRICEGTSYRKSVKRLFIFTHPIVLSTLFNARYYL